MKIVLVLFTIIIFSLIITPDIFADTTPTPTGVPQEEQNALGDSLNSFFSSFNWISDGLIFNTPDVTSDTIKLQDGTQLSGISTYKNIFYEIAIPIFAIILAGTALFHIGSDNTAQLYKFFKRLGFVTGLFILSPYLLSYSIEFINLLDQQIMHQQNLNLVTFLTAYFQSGDFNNVLKFSISPILFFSPTTILQMLIMIISMGFLLVGFLYIVFQAVIRFIALLLLTVLLPVIIPFALSEKTENITNTYFRIWTTFLIQQPAFVLGFAIITTIFGNLLNAHSNSIGTLFLYSGSLIFLGGVNVFVARIFSDGWDLIRMNGQSVLGSSAITGFGSRTVNRFKDGALTGRTNGLRSQAGADFGRKLGFLTMNKNENTKEEKAKQPHAYKYTDPNSSGYYKKYTGDAKKEQKKQTENKKDKKTNV